MFRIAVPTILLIFVSLSAFSQHDEDHGDDFGLIVDPIAPDDSLKRVLHDFGKFGGHFRSYFMSTVNNGSSPDYFALATGGGLAYYSPVIRNFQLGISGFMIYNVASSPLTPDNGYANRYEVGLFDVTDPENRKDLDRLENLYLRYYLTRNRRSFAQFGKFHINTPLMNGQDTRMRPNLQEGLWAEFKEWDKVKIRTGWIWSTSPRSTVEWYGIGESVGIYGSGKAVNGEPAEYEGHVHSRTLLIANIELAPLRHVNYQYWNYYADNLFNIALQKLEFKKRLNHRTWLAGVQHIWQASLSEATLPVEQQYIGAGHRSHTISGRIGVTGNHSGREWLLNYTRITAHGRLLFPREWGTETLYTYNNRERMEGAGDVHALMLEHSRYLDRHHHLSLRTRSGVYKMPDIADASLNKYSLPSFYQLTVQANYHFTGFLKGLQAQMLYTYKGNLDPAFEDPSPVTHNKTDMHHVGVRMDYFF